MVRYGSLFAGIGGIDLGFDRCGMLPSFQVERDPWCRMILAKHWPDVSRFDDVRSVGKHNLESVDVLCGGFPCQDISDAGLRVGIDGERSGLWSEYHRIICEIRPRFVVVENVAALLRRGVGRVLGDLARARYDAEWRVFRACEFGLPHHRSRVFIVAYPNGQRRNTSEILAGPIAQDFSAKASDMANRTGTGQLVRANSGRTRMLPMAGIQRVAHGLPGWMDRLRGIGNAVVPDIASWIGKRLLKELANG